MSTFTITYQDRTVKGFTSFHSYLPDWMGSLNNKFYSVKDGQLYQHDDANNPVRNNFYGVQYSSTVKFMVNEEPSVIKIAKAINIEGNKSVDVTIKGYLWNETTSITESTLTAAEFLEKEGRQHAYLRRSELTGDYSAKSAYGIGVLASVADPLLTFTTSLPSSLISIGDSVYNDSELEVGVITAYYLDAGSITLSSIINAPSVSDFCFGLKEGRIEGSEMRGYNFEVELTDSTTGALEIFAINTEVVKSHPS